MKISNRAFSIQASPIRKLNPLALVAEKKGIKVIKLNIGQPDLPAPPAVLKKIRRFRLKNISYAPSQGLASTVQAWQTYYKNIGHNFAEKEIIVTTAGSESLVFALAAIADPGQEILIFEPFYTNYNGFASLVSVKLVPIKTKIENGFHLPKISEIENKITKKTRGIIICNPNNPTGTVYTKKELASLVKIAKKHHLFLINDEVYREFIFDGKKHSSLLNFKGIEKNIILCDSVSKRFNLCGARVGCLVSKNKEIIENVLKFAQARLSSPTIEQLAVIPILINSKSYTKQLIKEYEQRRLAVMAGLKNIPDITYHFPEGAFYIIVKLPIKNSEHFCRWLLEKFNYHETTVMLAPASGFYATPGLGKNEVRIAFVYRPEILKKALEILKIALSEYKRRY